MLSPACGAAGAAQPITVRSDDGLMATACVAWALGPPVHDAVGPVAMYAVEQPKRSVTVTVIV